MPKKYNYPKDSEVRLGDLPKETCDKKNSVNPTAKMLSMMASALKSLYNITHYPFSAIASQHPSDSNRVAPRLKVSKEYANVFKKLLARWAKEAEALRNEHRKNGYNAAEIKNNPNLSEAVSSLFQGTGGYEYIFENLYGNVLPIKDLLEGRSGIYLIWFRLCPCGFFYIGSALSLVSRLLDYMDWHTIIRSDSWFNNALKKYGSWAFGVAIIRTYSRENGFLAVIDEYLLHMCLRGMNEGNHRLPPLNTIFARSPKKSKYYSLFRDYDGRKTSAPCITEAEINEMYNYFNSRPSEADLISYLDAKLALRKHLAYQTK